MLKIKCRILWICVWMFASLSALGQVVLISELVADNSTLQDADGDSPDWIELYNNTDSIVDLTGWHLTDKTNLLTQWTFPATNIAPREFLLIFASDKDRAVAGEELHTNFKLSSKGDYIALMRPDGTTLEDGFAFPALPKDIAYGRASNEETHRILVTTGAACSARIPTSSGDANGWRETSFDDSSWMQGITGVGFDTKSSYSPLIGLNTIAMRGANASIYIRVPFVCTNAVSAKALTLKMKYDDGFVAYLNGTQVQAANFEGTPAWNSLASTVHADDLAFRFKTFDLSAHLSLLQEGANTLAIQGLNKWKSDGDLLFVPRIEIEYPQKMNATAPGFLGNSTPGIPNLNQLYDGILETPVQISPKHGFFEAPFQAELSSPEMGVAIRYTLDGSTPTSNSTLYTAPIPISSTTVLRASAFRTGWKPSLPRTESYLFLDDIILQPRTVNASGQVMRFGMDSEVVNTTYTDAAGNSVTVKDALRSIPSLSIVTDEENLFDPATGIYVNAQERWERPASFELIYPDGTQGFNINSGLRMRGGYSRHFENPKHSFRLFFRGEYGAPKLRYPLFGKEGVGEYDKIDLRTPQNYSWAWKRDSESIHNTFLRDVFVRDTSRDMDQPYARSRYYHLYLNGQYWGLFQTEERLEARYAASHFGGSSEDYDIIKAAGRSDPIVEPHTTKTTDGNFEAYHRLFVAATNGLAGNTAYFALRGLDSAGYPDPAGEKLLDVKNLIDYLLQIYHAGATDNPISWFLQNSELNNFLALYDRTDPDGFKWLHHDNEHSFDVSQELDRTGPFPSTNFNLFKYFNPQTLHDKLVANAEYRLAFADGVYRNYFNDGALTPSNSAVRIDARAAEIDRAIVAHSARWGSVTRNRNTWVDAVAITRAFIVESGRVEQVVEYLRADGLIPSLEPPQINHSGGRVNPGTEISLSTTEGTIYYSTDGSDPRAIGGAISGSLYSAPLAIHEPTVIRARGRKADGEWSALAKAVFWTPEVPLVITELMYHAASNQLDFIEIRNIAADFVSLRDYSLDGAVRFDFDSRVLAPGEYALVVKNVAAFSVAYPAAIGSIAGEYQGDFDNGGEKGALAFGTQSRIEFTYSDARNWPQAADGAGHSLVPLDAAMGEQEHGSLDYGGNWRASTFAGGSPGYTDPVGIPTVLLNEITAHTDTGQPAPFDSNDQIELFNPTATDIVLNGWFLSDDPVEPSKWAIPNGTLVPAFGFVLFDENDFHPGRTNGFGLNKAGEQVLLSMQGKIIDALRFKGQANGASQGRYPDGSAAWMTTVPTPGSPNQSALSVHISAVMYHPAGGNESLEYIQLENSTANSVGFETSAGSWRLDGGVSFTFPAGSSLPAGEKLWLVPFDPVADPSQLALFSSTYGLISAQETFLGPYQGQLADGGARVALERPQESDDPLDPFAISWIVVDELYYFNQAPWPVGVAGQPLLRTGSSSWSVPTTFDADADGLPDAWESAYGVDDPELDFDGDGLSNIEEYWVGTDPTNAASRFVLHLNGETLSWSTASGRRYDVLWTPDLSRGFQLLEAALPASISNYADTAHAAYPHGFYKVVARLPDSMDADGDGLPDHWEAQYFIDAEPMDDPDGDGRWNIEEYLAGTHPTDPTDFFHISQIGFGDGMILQWAPSIYGRTYTVLFTPSLDEPFRVLSNGIAYPQNSFTNAEPGFYQVEVALP